MSEDINAQLMELGLNIAYYRKLKGITQAQLAEKIRSYGLWQIYINLK